ncbi:MFS transporter [Kitasatospora purpeofusca]|uniref:MFS transporter n=1 Tax=Kitasatospora purpeofusca TaxID=67352 RepID=UPI0033C76576
MSESTLSETVKESVQTAPLWTRNFRLFFAARGVAVFGDGLVPVGLAAGLILNGNGAAAIGGALGIYMAGFAGFVIFGGVLADRYSPRRMMVLADLLRMAVAVIIAVLFLTDHASTLAICTLSGLTGLGAALFQPGVASMIPSIASDVHKANSVVNIMESTMRMSGPVLAGVVAGFFGAGTVFLLNAATFAVSALCLFSLRVNIPARGGKRPSFFTDLVEGWQEFRARAWLWGVIAIYALFGLGVAGPMLPLTAATVSDNYGSVAYGSIMAANGLGSVLGGLLALRIRPVRPLAAGSIALLGYACNVFILSAGAPIGIVAFGQVLAGLGLAFWLVMWATTLQTQVPTEALNRLHSYDVAGSLIMVSLGRIASGPISEWIGVKQFMMISGFINIAVVAGLLAAPAIRNLRRIS